MTFVGVLCSLQDHLFEFVRNNKLRISPLFLDEEKPHLKAYEAEVESCESVLGHQVKDSSVIEPYVERQPANCELE